jgi:hypothetical protein
MNFVASILIDIACVLLRAIFVSFNLPFVPVSVFPIALFFTKFFLDALLNSSSNDLLLLVVVDDNIKFTISAEDRRESCSRDPDFRQSRAT